jgi:hypothetical protein
LVVHANADTGVFESDARALLTPWAPRTSGSRSHPWPETTISSVEVALGLRAADLIDAWVAAKT